MLFKCKPADPDPPAPATSSNWALTLGATNSPLLPPPPASPEPGPKQLRTALGSRAYKWFKPANPKPLTPVPVPSRGNHNKSSCPHHTPPNPHPRPPVLPQAAPRGAATTSSGNYDYLFNDGHLFIFWPHEPQIFYETMDRTGCLCGPLRVLLIGLIPAMALWWPFPAVSDLLCAGAGRQPSLLLPMASLTQQEDCL